MSIFQRNGSKLVQIKEKVIDLEKDIQKLTEENLGNIFDLKFVSGSLNNEFSVRTNEQDFYIDTLAFDELKNSFVIIEYKKNKSFSVIDQGFAYLAAMLNSQADFVLELNEKLGRNKTKKDINWEESRVIFISNEFTNYQRNAINLKDLPMHLYEVKLYENNIIEYNPIKPYKTNESIKKISKDKTIQRVSREVKVYTIEDLFNNNWTDSRELFELLREKILRLGNIKEAVVKHYVAYKAFSNGQWYNFLEIIPQANGLKVYLDISKAELKDPEKITEDCSKVGHWATGNTRTKIILPEDIGYAFFLIKQVFEKFGK